MAEEFSQPARGRAVILTAHGTASPAGRQVVLDLVDAVAAARPDLTVTDAYVDVQTPTVADAVTEAASTHEDVVVVPLLFCGGYHVRVDVAKAVAPWENARSTGALGPGERLADLLAQRLREAGARPTDAVVLAAAGSSRPEANADARTQARMLARIWGGTVDVGFGSAGTPRIADAVAANRERPGGRVAVASLLLGEGHFYNLLQRCGADVVTGPLRASEQVIAQVLDRIDAPVR